MSGWQRRQAWAFIMGCTHHPLLQSHLSIPEQAPRPLAPRRETGSSQKGRLAAIPQCLET